MTLSIKTFGMTTGSIAALNITSSITEYDDTQYTDTQHEET